VNEASGKADVSRLVTPSALVATVEFDLREPDGVALADVCFEAHYGLKSDIVRGPKSANERNRSRGRALRRGARACQQRMER
jgi:hypothetical protein